MNTAFTGDFRRKKFCQETAYFNRYIAKVRCGFHIMMPDERYVHPALL